MQLLVETLSDHPGEPLQYPVPAWHASVIDSLRDGVALLEVSERGPSRLRLTNRAFNAIAGLAPALGGAIPLDELADSNLATALERSGKRCATDGAPSLDRCKLGGREPRIYELSGLPFGTQRPGHLLVTVIVRDITPEETLRSNLHARDAEFHGLIDNALDYIARYDTRGRIVYVNMRMQRDGPLDTARVKGRTLVEVRPNSRGARRFHECVLQVARTGNRSEVYFRLDFPLSDSEAWHHVRFVAERDQRGEIVSVLAIGRDVTEHRHLERALLEVTNREQLRLGSELHDGLGQELTGLSLTASALAAAARRGRPPTAKSLKYIADIAAGAINTCREIARGLTPLATHNGDLVGALRNLARVQRHSGGVPVTFECTGEARLNVGDTQVDHLYRIAQEGLTNARKHAKAGAIFIGIDIQPHQVRLSIVDDGIGMPSISDGNGRLGLTTMRYRASLIGGQLTVDSLTGGGTRLVCQCPQEPEPPGTPN